jgi:hypothetical protein
MLVLCLLLLLALSLWLTSRSHGQACGNALGEAACGVPGTYGEAIEASEASEASGASGASGASEASGVSAAQEVQREELARDSPQGLARRSADANELKYARARMARENVPEPLHLRRQLARDMAESSKDEYTRKAIGAAAVE